MFGLKRVSLVFQCSVYYAAVSSKTGFIMHIFTGFINSVYEKS